MIFFQDTLYLAVRYPTIDCEQSLFFFRFSESNGRARERRSRETRETRAARAWPFACLAFCSMDYRKKRDCS